MNGSARHTGVRTARVHATPEVAPITRAIRNALAVSAAVLALSVGTTAHAGVCNSGMAPDIHSCSGALLQSMPDIEPVDLTRIVGNAPPSSVLALEATTANDTWNADATTITAGLADAPLLADIMGVDDMTVVDDGDLAFAVPTDLAFGPGAIEMLTEIDNGSDIDVSGYGGNVRALYAFDDIVTVDNSASITAEAAPLSAGGYAAAIGVRAAGYDVEVHNEYGGLIGATAISDGGRARARAVYATGYFEDVTVANEGDIRAYARADGGIRAEAHGVYAFGYGSANNIYNAGDIQVGAQSDGGSGYATGITSIGYGQGDNVSRVVNTGSIDAGTNAAYAYAFGVLNLTRQRYGDAYFANEGDIHAEATGDFATATGALNLALRYGDATTTNTGSIEAVASGDAGATATGLYNYALIYDAIVDNSGVVGATATGDAAVAVGIYNHAELYGGTFTVNSGDVGAHADGGVYLVRAAGVVSTAEASSDLTNYGNVDVTASSVDGAATATGLYALSYELSTVRNYGDVSAHAQSANGDASAYGAFAFGGFSGIGLLINGGDLHAEASAGNGGFAYAAGGVVVADVASIFNDVSMSATASAGEGGTALATAARTYGLNSVIYSYGDLSANATANGGLAQAIGANNYGYTSGVVYNAGNIAASAAADGGMAAAYGVYSVGIFYAYAGNMGTIAAEAVGDEVVAMGLVNASYLDAVTVNQGSITAVAEGGVAAYGAAEAAAFGVYNFAALYDSVVDNSGSISAAASATADISGTNGFLQAQAIGARAINGYGIGDTVVVNSGEIDASAVTSQGYAAAWGAVAQSPGAYGGISRVENDGAIRAYGHADIGIAYATGAYAVSQMGTSDIVNHGDVAATVRVESGRSAGTLNYAYATAAKALSTYGGDAHVANYGNIEAHASALGAITGARGIQTYGQYSSVINAAGASITAVGEVDLWGAGRATGIEAGAKYGADVTNDGSVVAYGHGHGYSYGVYETHYSVARSTGIYAGAGMRGDVSVVNNGDIIATSIAENSITFFNGGAGATGIDTYAKYDATVVNTGSITATALSELGIVGAYGVIGNGKYSTNVINEAGASIVALASVGSLYSDAYGGRAFSSGTHVFGNGMQQGTVYNAGSIISHATVTPDNGANEHHSIAHANGAGVGAYSTILNGTVVNLGDIEAVASADFGYATAYGSYVLAQYRSDTSNSGVITASASAADGDAWAVGSFGFASHTSVYVPCEGYYCDWSQARYVVDAGDAMFDNSGDIVAMANAQGGVGHSYGAAMIGAVSAGVANSGHISAGAIADDAVAFGILANSQYGQARVENSGVIEAMANGDIASATGALAMGCYSEMEGGCTGVTVDNDGRIVAMADGATPTAIGVATRVGYGDRIRIDNNGTIVAAAYGDDATATAISMDSHGSNVLTNTGTISAFGDGTRIAILSSVDAAATIVNRGSITGAIVTGDLDDSFENAAGGTWVAVGDTDFGAGDNHFANGGTIVMDDAALTLGGHSIGTTLLAIQPASHISGSTFDNSGTIHVSGANNAIDTGTFANNGVISFVDGAPDDVLTIAGDFSGDGVINLDVSGLNQTSDQLYIDGSIMEPMAQTVNVNLLDLPTAPSMDIAMIATSGTLAGDFVLGNVQHAQDGFVTMAFALNVSAESVSLGVDVTGLNATGSLAAIVAPGVQSLVNAQIGTFRQRMGVVPEMGEAGLGPWVRMFADSGDVDAGYSGNFGAGGLGFHQSNHGWEVGLDTRPSEHVAFGAFIAKSDGSQGLEGAGSNRFDGSTFGLYGTWFGSHGTYIDVSHRWTGVDARLRSAMGTHTTKASAQSFNVEGGFTAWTSAGGLNIVPQLQYTRTRISDIRTLHASQAEFVNEGGMSWRGRLGVAFDQSFQSGGFTLTPYGSFNVVREFDGSFDHAINGGIRGTTSTDGTSAMVELGLGARKGTLSVTGGANWMDGGAVDSVTGAQLTVRYSW